MFVLILLAGFLVGLKIIKEITKPTVRPLETKVDLIKKDLSPALLKQITVQHNGRLFILGHHDGTWRVQSLFNIKAQEDAVEQLVQNLNLLHGELRSSKAAFFKDYDIEDDRAIRLTLKSNDDVSDTLLFGRKRHGNGHFVRLEGSEEVYAVDVDVLKAFGLSGNLDEARIEGQPWADKHVFDVDPKDIQSIRIDVDRDRVLDVQYNENDDTWQFSNKYALPLNIDRLKGYLETIRRQKGFNIEAADNVNFDVMDWIATFTLKDSREITLFRTQDGDKFYFKRGDLPYAIQYSVYHFENFHKSDAQLIVENPLQFDKESVEKVDIYFHKNKQHVTLHPILLPEEEWITEDEMGMALSNPDKRGWMDNDNQRYMLEDAKRVLHFLGALSFKDIIILSQEPQPYLTISFLDKDVEKNFNIGEDNGEGCFPLFFSDHQYGYCLSERDVARFENAIQVLTENIVK